jgi:tetratricopeptide (TPR) repeat protein
MSVGSYHVEPFKPVYRYVRPEAEVVKTRSLSGSAFIDFPVSDTKIHPDYRNNSVELTKIFASIDSVKNDKDNTITELSIKGYASPESPYSNNMRLAMGRTQSLKEYVQKLYHFGSTFINTSYEPEDWEGLREYVESSNLPNRAAILALIDSGREPDNKEWKLKSTYPADYQHLLKNIYPALRHSDYVVEYTVRSYTDIEEIKRVLATAPQNLSLEELYLVANSYESGSDEHHEVFEVAVRMFPEDEIANLNAANSAMQKRDLTAAARYLKRAGNSAEAIYARGAYAALEEDYDTARYLFRQSVKAGLAQGQIAIDEINAFVASISESKPNKTK